MAQEGCAGEQWAVCHTHGSALPAILFGSFARPEITVGLTLSLQHLASRAAGKRGPCRTEARRYKNNVALPFKAARSLIDLIDTLTSTSTLLHHRRLQVTPTK